VLQLLVCVNINQPYPSATMGTPMVALVPQDTSHGSATLTHHAPVQPLLPVQLPDARGTLVLMPPLLVRRLPSLSPGLSAAALYCCCMLPEEDCSGRTAPWLLEAVGGAPAAGAAPASVARPAALLLLAPSPSRPAAPEVSCAGCVRLKLEAGSSCSNAPDLAAAAGAAATAPSGTSWAAEISLTAPCEPSTAAAPASAAAGVAPAPAAPAPAAAPKGASRDMPTGLRGEVARGGEAPLSPTNPSALAVP
jgi:hypothetical protein